MLTRHYLLALISTFGMVTATHAVVIPTGSITPSGAGGDGPASNVLDGNNGTWTYGGHALTFQLDGIYTLTGYTYRDRPTGNSDPLAQNFFFTWDAFTAGGWSGSIPATSNDTNPVTTQSGSLSGSAGTLIFWSDIHRGAAEITFSGNKIADKLAMPTVVGNSTPAGLPTYQASHALDNNIDTEFASFGAAYLSMDFGTATKVSHIQFIDREVTTGKWEFSNTSDFSVILLTKNYDNSIADPSSADLSSSLSDPYRPRLLDLTLDNISARYVRWTSLTGGNGGLRETAFFTVIPEPTSASMLLFGAFMLMLLGRHRK